VAGDELAGVLLGCLIGGFILAAVEQEVVANATADETALNARQSIDGVVDIEQFGVIGIQVRTDLRMDAAGSSALLTSIEVASVHPVHIG